MCSADNILILYTKLSRRRLMIAGLKGQGHAFRRNKVSTWTIDLERAQE